MSKEISYGDFKVVELQGRYITNEHIEEFLLQLNSSFNLKVLGESVLDKPIYGLQIGTGPKRILMWSQMHGNESTTTKAVLDLIKYLMLELGNSRDILKSFAISIIPILNPDGAEVYTRINANQIDLNRDAQERSQPESKILRKLYDDFQPHYCFNLHDQRTIFNVRKINRPATISFLAPAFDEERTISESRLGSMKVIAAMNQKLQTYIPGQIGRYDDSFNQNCVGDAFQMLQTPTILFEAGHFPKDYEREKTREYIHMALMEALDTIRQEDLDKFTSTDYFDIPENQKLFCDVLITNAHVLDLNLEQGSKVSILFKEILVGETIEFKPKIEIQTSEIVLGHEIKDASNFEDREWLEKRGILSLFS